MVNRPLPALPDPGDTDWEDWAAGVHDAVASLAATYVAKPTLSIDLCAAPFNATPGQDVTTALQTAINIVAAAGGGEIVFSKLGTYLLNGAPQTGTALTYAYNGQILFPAVPWLGKPNTPIRIRGALPSSSGVPTTGQAAGVVLQSNATNAWMFDCVPAEAQWSWQWTGIMPIFENIILRSPAGGTAGGINALCTLRAHFEHVQVDTPSPWLQPTGTLPAIQGPHGYNNGDVTFRDVSIRGMPIGIGLGEHYVLDNVEIISCAIAFQAGFSTHTCYFGYVDVEQCKVIFDLSPSGSYLGVFGHLDIEQASLTDASWNAPGQFIGPNPAGTIVGFLTLNIAGSPLGSLALAGNCYNLDLAVLYTNELEYRGGASGWRGKHPIENFKRLQGLSSTGGNPGLAWPTMHPWRLLRGSFAVAAQKMTNATSATATAQAALPVLRGNSPRRISTTLTLAATAYNVSISAARVNGGTNDGKQIEVQLTNGNLYFKVAGTSVYTYFGAVTGGSTHTVAIDVNYGPDGLPTTATVYLDGVLISSRQLTSAERALMDYSGSSTFPQVEDSITLWQNDTSAITKVAVKDLPPMPSYVTAGTVTLVAGVCTVSDKRITTASLVRLHRQAPGGTLGLLSVALSAGTSFTVNSSSTTDTSTIYYEIASY